MFSALWFLQIVSIWCKNCLKSPIFKKLSYFDQCLHSFYSVIIPSPSKDWSVGEGDCAQHFQRMKIVDAEVISTIKLNSLFQAAHLIPMFILGNDYFSNYLLNYVELQEFNTFSHSSCKSNSKALAFKGDHWFFSYGGRGLLHNLDHNSRNSRSLFCRSNTILLLFLIR